MRIYKKNATLFLYITVVLLIGVIIAMYLSTLEGYTEYRSIPSFHILIATAGRPSLKKLLDSLQGELTENDAITIVFDGENAKTKSGISPEWFLAHKSTVNILEQTPNLGFWGHGIRNKYQSILSPGCTFVMHADDDDTYIPGSFNTLRKVCSDPTTLYIARMERIYENNNKPTNIIPSMNTTTLELGNIGTPNGIIPSAIAKKGEWGHFYGGDFHYYNGVKNHTKNIVFLDHIIYTVTLRK